jgi:predicted component of type VI protein secretion system
MPVTVKIFTKHAGRPALFQTREFETLPVTIGRDATCTLALEDPHKHISRVHVELEEEDGAYWVCVVSKVNPVMVKGRRYGPGTRLALKSGDSFEMGEFEVQVAFPEKLRPTLPNKKSLISTFAEEDNAADIPPPDPGILQEPTLVGGSEPTYIGPTAKPPAAASAFETNPVAAGSMNEALRIFLEGAGMPAMRLSPAESERLLRDCGGVLRAAVDGLMMLLIARGEMCKEFEAEERTMVAASDNNPLMLMADPHDAMQFLLDPSDRTDGFVDSTRAIGDACEDLRAHEIALMAGMRAAILAALRRFDPQMLEKSFEKAGRGFSFGGRKAKLWELFISHQQKLAQEAQEDFNKVFGRDFMSAYQAQLRRLKTGQ